MIKHVWTHKRLYAGAAAGLAAAAGLGAGFGHLAGHHPPTHPTPVATAPAAQSSDEGRGTLIGHCGVERWPVKTGTDADALKVDFTPQPATVAQLVGLPAPPDPPNASRVAPTELTTFVLETTLVGYKMEGDNDYHLVVSDRARTMIVEIPNPGCVGSSSPFRPQISQARAQFDARYVATATFQTVSASVVVTGVGFFDHLHRQTGVAKNGIELHPVLAIEFK